MFRILRDRAPAAEVVAAVDPEGADGGHVGPAVGVDRRQPEGVVAGSTGAGFLGQVGLERRAHIRPVEWGEVVEVGEVLRSGFGSSHVSTDDRRRRNSSVEHHARADRASGSYVRACHGIKRSRAVGATNPSGCSASSRGAVVRCGSGGPRNVSQQAVAVPGLFGAAESDPLCAAIDALYVPRVADPTEGRYLVNPSIGAPCGTR